jgi:hypothetical protein
MAAISQMPKSKIRKKHFHISLLCQILGMFVFATGVVSSLSPPARDRWFG